MEHNPTANELDLIQVIDNADDFVQILGVSPNEDEEEIEVASVELDGGESFFIDVDDEPLLGADDHQEVIDIHENASLEDSFDADVLADVADIV